MVAHPHYPAEVTLRPKNQLTLPANIVADIGAHIGQRFLIERKGTTVILHLVPESFAGTLAGLYGSSEEAKTYIENERSSWE